MSITRRAYFYEWGNCMTNETSNTIEANITARDAFVDGQGGKQPVSANVFRTGKRQTHDRPPDLEKKIGKTTYRVWAHFSTTSKETLEDKIKRMLRDDVRRAMQAEA